MNDDRLRRYVGTELWALREAAYLLCGRLPRAESEFMSKDRKDDGPVAHMYRALKDATINCSIFFLEVDGALMRRRLRPAEVGGVGAEAGTGRAELAPPLQAESNADVRRNLAKDVSPRRAPIAEWVRLARVGRGRSSRGKLTRFSIANRHC